MRHDLLMSEPVRSTIRDLAERRLLELPETSAEERERTKKKLEKQLKDVADGLAQELVTRMDSLRFLRFFGAAVNVSALSYLARQR